MILLEQKSLTALWEGAANHIFFGQLVDDGGDLYRGSSMTRCYDNFLGCDSMEYQMDVWEDLHLTKSRFPVLQRTYVDIDTYEAFLKRCHNTVKERGAVLKMPAIDHAPRGINRTKKTGNYAHGGCILGWTFRMHPGTKQPILTMHSRVSYISYMGALDLALCFCMAQEIGREIARPVEDFGFRWYCDSFQFAHMQSVSYVWNRPELMKAIKDPATWPAEQYPTIKLMRNTIREFVRKHREGFLPEEEKFAQLMRYRRRWTARVTGDNPKGWASIPVTTLNLDALRTR